MNKSDKIPLQIVWPTYVLVALLIMFVVLVFMSWLANATGMKMHTLLSSEGLRWLFLNVADIISSPWLVYLILGLSCLGAVSRSGLWEAINRMLHWDKENGQLAYRQRVALISSGLFFFLYLACLFSLVFSPYAALLSVTGTLFPSPFLAGLFPALVFGGHVTALLYGSLSNRLRNFHETFEIFYWGIQRYAIWIIIYLTGALFWETFQYTVGRVL